MFKFKKWIENMKKKNYKLLKNMLLSAVGIFLTIFSFLAFPDCSDYSSKNFTPNIAVKLENTGLEVESQFIPNSYKKANITNTNVYYPYNWFSMIVLEKNFKKNSKDVFNINIGPMNSSNNNIYSVICSEVPGPEKISFNFKTEKEAKKFKENFIKLK
ncbi:MAG: hypothetical protein ACRDDY_09325 [Clostridium sp.]|uniref:hypothetical protein n=1 Tax=Clostridium sp. TaxID=1506 RepID=UPI003EE5E77A